MIDCVRVTFFVCWYGAEPNLEAFYFTGAGICGDDAMANNLVALARAAYPDKPVSITYVAHEGWTLSEDEAAGHGWRVIAVP